jgi:hypothetical protein
MKRFALALLLICGAAAGCEKEPSVPQGPTPDTVDEQKTLDEFKTRVDQYVALHKQAEAKLPNLPTDATPEQIDKNQRELGRLIVEARANAKQGELFTPAMETLLRKHLARVFRTPDGPAIKDSVNDENPVGQVDVAVNERYPDNIPISTMPPDLLQKLPKMPEEMEYRFVGRHLVILDTHAHLIADFVTNAIPQ